MCLHSDEPRHVTLVFDRPVFSDQGQAIDDFLDGHRGELVGRGERLILRYHVADHAYSAEDAVQDALLDLWRALKQGKIQAVGSDGRLASLLEPRLRHEVLDEVAREKARKRSGAREAGPDADLDAIDSHAPRPDDQVAADEEVERKLGLLDRRDPSLRGIAVRKEQSYTHEEIAADLGLSLATVERKVALIKAILTVRDHKLG